MTVGSRRALAGRSGGAAAIVSFLALMGWIVSAAATPAQDFGSGERPIQSSVRMPIRDVADGSGPSNLIVVGRYLVVVDPWAAEIRRYDPAAPVSAPHACRFVRSFSPWRAERLRHGIRLVAEPYGPNPGRGYDFRPRTQMTITAAALDTMADGAACTFPVRRYEARRRGAPRIRWIGGEHPGSVALFRMNNGVHARLRPQGGIRAEIYAARDAGRLSNGRTLVWWSEVDDYPLGSAGGAGSPQGGRVSASHYVGVVGARGGAPIAVLRLESATSPPLLAGAPFAASSLLGKPGFDYVAATSAKGMDMLWLMVSDSASPGNRQFALRGYDITGLPPAGRRVVRLVSPGASPTDRQDADDAEEVEDGGRVPFSDVSRRRWFTAARSLVRRQIAFSWMYPAGALTRPCGGADRCTVGANQSGALGIGPAFSGPVVDRIDRQGGANWMRPRQLVGVAPGMIMRGIPYSIGGIDLADTFLARLAAGYAGTAANPPPIGHIREGMEWPQAAGNYPLGIDCSALLAKVYAIGVRSTGTMMKPVFYVGGNGKRYRVPRGSDHGCPQPVRHLSEMRAGDIFLRDGHVVIFAGTTKLGNMMDGSRAVRVLESSSRCGGVCESVYDPTYFAGWWMLRIRTSRDGRECPRWLDRDRR
ncbi:hypothetical protein [uncultured Sphingomonas sp.]|uniref:hypothetical protein n=1 Tax=uncultured Sphingomonas sp. TaxID=158754 RepID=UPI0035CB452C